MLREVRDHAVERRGHRVEPAEQLQVADPELLGLGERTAVDLAGLDLGEQPVVGVLALLLERGHEVVVDRVARGVALRLDLLRRLPLGTDRVVAPAQEVGEVALREPDEREEDRGRQRRREVLVELARALVGEAVDDLVHERTRFGLERRHLRGRELRVEHAAVLAVLGRVDRQRDQRLVVAEVDHVLRGEHLGVLERPPDVVVGRHVHGVAAEHAGAAVHGALARAPRGTR